MYTVKIQKDSGVSFKIKGVVSIAVTRVKNGVYLMMDGPAKSIRRDSRVTPKKWPMPIKAAQVAYRAPSKKKP